MKKWNKVLRFLQKIPISHDFSRVFFEFVRQCLQNSAKMTWNSAKLVCLFLSLAKQNGFKKSRQEVLRVSKRDIASISCDFGSKMCWTKLYLLRAESYVPKCVGFTEISRWTCKRRNSWRQFFATKIWRYWTTRSLGRLWYILDTRTVDEKTARFYKF